MHIKPFLKWAGGKKQSLPLLKSYIGDIDNVLIEPFVGSGIVSFNMFASKYIIADINKDLISVYNMLKYNSNYLIQECKKYFTGEYNTEKNYYKLRHKFNTTDDRKEKAVLFIYLNRHCFNGLCRYNKKNLFNTPFGKYKNPYFPETELKYFSKRLKTFEIYCQSFEDTFSIGTTNDFIYCDPPYIPLSNSSSFINYNSEGFLLEQQQLLSNLAEESKSTVLISNSDTELTRKIYASANEAIQIKVSRTISSKVNERKSVGELLFIYNN